MKQPSDMVDIFGRPQNAATPYRLDLSAPLYLIESPTLESIFGFMSSQIRDLERDVRATIEKVGLHFGPQSDDVTALVEYSKP